MIKTFSILGYGNCPICPAPVWAMVHDVCVRRLNFMLLSGEAEMQNWDAPLPRAFHALRWGIEKQLARQTILIMPTGHGKISEICLKEKI